MRAFLLLCGILVAAYAVDTTFYGGTYARAAEVVGPNVVRAILAAVGF